MTRLCPPRGQSWGGGFETQGTASGLGSVPVTGPCPELPLRAEEPGPTHTLFCSRRSHLLQGTGLRETSVMTRPSGNRAEPGTQAPSGPLETQSGLLPPRLPPRPVSFLPSSSSASSVPVNHSQGPHSLEG